MLKKNKPFIERILIPSKKEKINIIILFYVMISYL